LPGGLVFINIVILPRFVSIPVFRIAIVELTGCLSVIGKYEIFPDDAGFSAIDSPSCSTLT